MKFGSYKHGHESAKHRALKLLAADMAIAAGADAVGFEVGGCDVVAVKRINGKEHKVGIEIEFSIRNVVRNIWRDMNEVACSAVLVVAGSETVRIDILAHLAKPENNCNYRSVFFTCADRLSEYSFRGIFDMWLCPDGVADTITERRCPVSAD